jgi:hypothetical protein
MSTQQEEQRLSQKKKQEEQRLTEQKKQEAGLLEAVVRDSVMSDLGPAPGLHRVQVKCVWGNYYRVNVFVGPDATSCKVAHSYFLEADGNGKILSSDPAITRTY